MVCPFFAHSLCQLEVVTLSSFFVEFECHSSSGSNSGVMNGLSIEREGVNNRAEAENYSAGGKEFNCVVK